MELKQKSILFGCIMIILVVMGIVIGWIITSKQNTFSGSTVRTEQEKPLYWQAPMTPDFRSDKAGKSPMGMDLVPVYKKSDINGITISPTVVQNLGVRTALVKRENLPRTINTVGYVKTDENNIEHIHSYEKGWIKKLYVKETGEYVEKDQLLMAIYSPVLVNAQQEFLLAIDYQSNKKSKSDNQQNNSLDFVDAAKLKLQALGVSGKQIAMIEKNKKADNLIDINAAISGYVTRLGVREGMYVTPTLTLLTIENLSKIWLIAEVYSNQESWVKIGQPVSVTIEDFPGKKWHGAVDFISPIITPVARTLQVRVVFDNPIFELKPNMFANMKIQAKPQMNVLTIPREALIRSGNGDHVILELGDGNFVAQEVRVGIESDDKYEILAGLKQDDKVVTSSQFLIDSESNVIAGMRRITTKDLKLNNGHDNSAAVSEVTGMGVIMAVDMAQHKIKIKHQPIKFLNWPAMTMSFNVAKNIDLSKFKINDNVSFVLENQNEEFSITSLMIMIIGNSHD
ncbi:MAG: Cu(I)/Ag(I) efflux system membrane fusion protein [Francisellaceae bacterium]|jgi:Cu(I)/Ag(I) efflux system membrane fusion protein